MATNHDGRDAANRMWVAFQKSFNQNRPAWVYRQTSYASAIRAIRQR
jgi:hypothetical protein